MHLWDGFGSAASSKHYVHAVTGVLLKGTAYLQWGYGWSVVGATRAMLVAGERSVDRSARCYVGLTERVIEGYET